MPDINWKQLQEAIHLVADMDIPRVDTKDGIKVYRVKNVIRIDIKSEER